MLNIASIKEQNFACLGYIIFGSNNDSQKLINLFARASEDLGTSLNFSETISHVCKVPIPILADWSTLFILNEKLSKLSFAHCYHPDPTRNRILTEYFQTDTADHSHRPITLDTLRNGGSATEIREVPSPLAGHLLTLPLIRNSDVLGFLTLGSKKSYAAVDILLAEEVARRAAIALYNSQRFQQAQIAEAELLNSKKLTAEANQAKSQFLANLSHEIRTPVSIILGFTDLLMSRDHTEEERLDWGQRVKQNGHSLLRLIDDLLNLTKTESGQFSLENENVSFNCFYKDLNRALSPQVGNKEIKLNFLLTSSVPANFITDAARLQQILVNIIGNAIKFTDTGAIAVSAGFQKNSGFLYFDIEDTGPGLTNKEVSKLFQPFSQAGTAHSKRCGGSGLGLALSLNLARLLGGDLELVSSEPGVGSIFRVFIKPRLVENTEFISKLDI